MSVSGLSFGLVLLAYLIIFLVFVGVIVAAVLIGVFIGKKRAAKKAAQGPVVSGDEEYSDSANTNNEGPIQIG